MEQPVKNRKDSGSFVYRVGGALARFFKMESAGGILLVLAAVAALIVANSPLFGFYNWLLNEVDFRIGFFDMDGRTFEIDKTLLHWINDGLMAVFFFLIGLEIKREIVEGELSSRDKAVFPAMGAIGGMAVPALCFFLINRGTPEFMAGWAIPAATDIAFALGVLMLMGSRVPLTLKVLLTAIAVLDDLGAIMIIALFYTDGVSVAPLYGAAIGLAALIVLNRKKVHNLGPYIVVGLFIWASVLEAGVHATLAGVVVALFIPMRCPNGKSPLKLLEHVLHPWVAFMVLPIFAFANAGVPFAGLGLADLGHPVTLGIILGLVVGKPIGILTMLWLAVKLRLSPKPSDVGWLELLAVGMLCGIGFTMSLFIGGLAYEAVEMQAYVRMGVLLASLIALIFSITLLNYALNRKDRLAAEAAAKEQKAQAA